jgi:ABC-type transport system substrate-binding protein
MQSRFIIPILFFLLCCCSRVSNIDESKTVFRYNESKGITSLDPAFARSLPLIWPVHQIYNGLIQLTDSLTVDPCIAKSWSISESGLEYTFNLRTDVTFHPNKVFPNGNGRQVVASDFVYSFGRIVDPKVASPGAWIFSVLDKNKPNTVNGCSAENDSTLVVYLKEPFPAFLGLLSMPYAYVVPFEAVEFYGRNFRSNPVGTGPFQLKNWREGEKLVLEKNSNYFEIDNQGNQLPYLDAVSITFIADKQSEFLEFLLGNIDYLSGIHAVSKDELLTRSGNLNPKYSDKIKMLTGPYLNTEYLGILVDTTLDIVNNNNPLKIKELRKAIGYGFDRARMMSYLRSNMGYPASNGFVPKGMPGFSDDVEGFQYNPDLSRELLAKAGFPDGLGLPTITISTTDDYVDICEFIQHQLADVGIKIQVEVFPGAAYREMMANSRMLFFRGSWVADYADPENYLSLFFTPNFSPGGPNYTHFSSKEFDNLYANALWQPNDSLRYLIYNRMDSLVMDNAVVIPLYYDKVVRFVNKDIIGMQTNPMNLLSLKQVKKNNTK